MHNIKIIVLTRDKSSQNSFLSRNVVLNNLTTFIYGAKSYLEEIENAIRTYSVPVLFLHDDVTVPASFISKVNELIRYLNQNCNKWGVVGNAGISNLITNFEGNNLVRYLIDGHGGANSIPSTVPAQTVDGNCLLINCPELKKSGIKLPKFPGFHFYDIFLCIASINCGCGVFISSNLFLFHKSKGNQAEFDKNKSSAKSVLARMIVDDELSTINGPIVLSKPKNRSSKKRLKTLAFEAAVSKIKRRVNLFVIQSSSNRLEITLRNCERFFAENPDVFDSLIVLTDNHDTLINREWIKKFANLNCNLFFRSFSINTIKEFLQDKNHYCIFINDGTTFNKNHNTEFSSILNSSYYLPLFLIPNSSSIIADLNDFILSPNFLCNSSINFENFLIPQKVVLELLLKIDFKYFLEFLPLMLIETSKTYFVITENTQISKTSTANTTGKNSISLVETWSHFFYKQEFIHSYFNFIIFRSHGSIFSSNYLNREADYEYLLFEHKKVLNSRSWKVTKPLRSFSYCIKIILKRIYNFILGSN